jgi:hypothetical protein
MDRGAHARRALIIILPLENSQFAIDSVSLLRIACVRAFIGDIGFLLTRSVAPFTRQQGRANGWFR